MKIKAIRSIGAIALLYPMRNGEFFDDKYLAYQQILDRAYKFMDEGNLLEACALLEVETDFDKSLYRLCANRVYYRDVL